jgi:hypothetical protein
VPRLDLRTLTLLGIAAACLALGTVAVYARSAIVDEDAFTARAVDALRSDEVREEVTDRLSDRLVDQSRALARWRPVVDDEARLLTLDAGFPASFADAARGMQRKLFSDRRALVSLDVHTAGAALKTQLAEREPTLATPLSEVEAGDLMDLSGGGIEGALRRLAPAGAELARLGIPAIVLALVLLAAAVLRTRERRRGVHAAALTVGMTGAALVAAWTIARALTVGRFDTSNGETVVGQIWDAYLGDLRLWTLALAVAGLSAAACVAATLPDGGRGRAHAAVRRRLAAERQRAPLALALLALAALVIAVPDVVVDLGAVVLAAALVYRAVHDLARSALR